MPAYVVFIRESAIHTPKEMEEYQRVSRENPMDPKMKPLAVYGAQVPIEGKAPDGVVILEFPTVEDAKTWYYGPYQNAAKHRRAAADYRGVIVEGWSMPG